MRLERSPAAELRRYGQSRPFRASSLLFAATRGAFPRLRTVPGIGRGEQKRIKVRKIERRSEIPRVLLNAGELKEGDDLWYLTRSWETPQGRRSPGR